MKKHYSTISNVLRTLRICKGYTCKEMGVKLGVSSSFVSQLETGKKMPSDDILQNYSKEFDISIDKILELSNPSKFTSKLELDWLLTIAEL